MNTSYKDYAALAYRRTILAATQRFLQEHLSSELPATRQLICEEVLASDRDTPPEAFLEYIEELQQEEQNVRLQMAQFEFVRRRDVRREQEKAAPGPEQKPQQPERKPTPGKS